jgi:hypothetical protein
MPYEIHPHRGLMRPLDIVRMRPLVSLRFVVLAACVALCAGCASLRESACRSGEEASINDQLYFGTARQDAQAVTADEWKEFLASSVTPRFPQGLSVWQSTGQWKGADGAVVHEASFVLNLVHPDDQRDEDAIRAIMAEYKARFHQEAVLRVRNRACISF